MSAENKHLGRGLSALLGEDEADYAQLDKLRVSKLVPIEFLHPGRYQPRHRMDDDQINDLANSIRQKGILQPILVRRHPDEPNAYEIIAGERRWRAAQRAELHEVPVVIKEMTDQDAMEIALVENLQRQDLSPLEEADGYRRLMDEFEHTQEKLAQSVGKSRSHVANMMRLLALPDPVKEMLDVGDLSAGHARALLNADGDAVELARVVVKKGLNVRQTERLAKKGAKPARAKAAKPAAQKDADTLALERDLANILGLKVDIKFQGGGGTLTLHYNSLEQLDDILHRLTHGGGESVPEPVTDDVPSEPAESVLEEEPLPEEPLSDAPLDLDEPEAATPAEPPGAALDDIADLDKAVEAEPDAFPEPGLTEPGEPAAELPEVEAEPVVETDAEPEPAGEPASEASQSASEDKPEEKKMPAAAADAFPSDWVSEAVKGEIDLEDEEDQ